MEKENVWARAWRNRFIQERMNAYPDDEYEERTAKAEADANEYEAALDAAFSRLEGEVADGQ